VQQTLRVRSQEEIFVPNYIFLQESILSWVIRCMVWVAFELPQ
jgi:hypothetical protein